MSERILFQPALLDDVVDAYAWYEERASGLGEEFLRGFYAAVAGVAREPMMHRKIYTDFRRVFLRRFPYALYYRIEGETILFSLLFHAARNPKLMRSELGNRRKNH